MASYREDQYFATLEPYSQRYLEALLQKLNTYRKFCQTSGKISKWQRSIQNYYGVSSDGTKSSNMISRGGDQGQLVMAKINDYRNLIQHQLILITSQRPAGQAKAVNSDPRSLKQARIGSQVVEYYLSQVGWEQNFVRAAEMMLVADEAFQILDFDTESGDAIAADPETGKVIKTGDPRIRLIAPWNMARDPYNQSADMMNWGIYSWRENKYDLAAKYPNQEKDILHSSTRKVNEIVFDTMVDKDTDLITVYALTHKQTASVPAGRITQFVPGAILIDGDFPYPEFNIYRMSQGDIMETGYGYSNNNDILAIEEITDALHSAVMTNQVTTGVNAIMGVKGMNIKHTEIAKGMPYFEVDPAHFDKLKTLQLTQTAPEIFAYLETLSRKKETLSGINSVVRGDPEGALRSNSGSALALVQAQSLQFNSGGQRAFYQALSKICTGLIKMVQRQEFGSHEKMIRITGKVQGEYLEEFKYKGTELSEVSSVVFEPVDPAFQSTGGKVAAADNLLNKGLIKNGRQYLTVVRTGSLDAFTEDDEADELAVKAENERLREGKAVSVLAVENHMEHIQGHMSVIASPESKEDFQLVDAVMAHIQEHTDLWQQLSVTNPALLIATKQQVLPPPPGMGGQIGAPPPGGGGGPLPIKGEEAMNMPQALGPDTALETKAGSVKEAQMPVNPMTKERVPSPAVQR